MPFVKIIYADVDIDYYYDSTDLQVIVKNNEWEEISQEDLNFLLSNKYQITQNISRNGLTPVVLVKPTPEELIAEPQKSVKELIDEQRAVYAESERKEQKRRDAAAAKRKAKQEERERKQFEKLKEKFSEAK